MARYHPRNVPTTNSVNQVERYLREEFERVRQSTDDTYELAEFALANFVPGGYCGVGQNAASNPLPDINAGSFIDYTGFDLELVNPTRGAVNDLDSDGIRLRETGLWYLTIKLTLEHLEAQAGRQIWLRIKRNGSSGLIKFRYGVGRNTGTTNLTLTYLAQMDLRGDAEDLIQLEIGSDADSFAGLDCIGGYLMAHYVSEYRGDYVVEAARV